MSTIPAVILLGAAVCLGIYLGVDYVRGVRSRPVMIGMHLLLGAGGMEVVAMLLKGTPDGTLVPAGAVGHAAAGLLLLALFTGLLAPMVGRQSRQTMNIALITHASAAAAGFVLLLAWFS